MAFKPSSADSTRAPGSTESIRKYRNVVDKRLRPWCAKKGFLHLEQLGVEQIREFRRTWPDGPGYAIKNLERLRTFFRFCECADWIPRNPAKAVKAPKPNTKPTLPFTHDENADSRRRRRPIYLVCRIPYAVGSSSLPR